MHLEDMNTQLIMFLSEIQKKLQESYDRHNMKLFTACLFGQ